MTPRLFATNVLHRIFIILIPWLFFSGICVGIISFTANISGIPRIFYLATFIGSIYRILVYDILNQEKTNRYFLQAYIISYIVFYILAQIIFKNSIYWWFPTKMSAGIFLCLSLIWVSAHKLQSGFIKYEYFLKQTNGLAGRKLYTFIKKDDALITDANEGLKGISGTVCTMFVAIFCALLLRLIRPSPAPLFLVVDLACFFVFAFLCFTYVKMELNVLFCTSLGLDRVFTVQRTQKLFVFIIIVILIVLLFLIASDLPFLNVKRGSSFLGVIWTGIGAFLGLFFSGTHASGEDLSEIFENSKALQPRVIPLTTEQIIPASEVGLTVVPVFTIAKYILFVVIGIVILRFVFAPLFKKGWSKFWRENHLLQYIKVFFYNCKTFFYNILHPSESEPYLKMATVQQQNVFKDKIGGLNKSQKAHSKKNEIGFLSKYFLRLIDFGSAHGCAFAQSLSPLEYTKLLMQVIPGSELAIVGQLFEKALYSKELLSEKEIEQYKNAIKKVISS